MFKNYKGAIRSGMIFVAACVLPAIVMAAGADFHVLGIVTAIDAKHIEVKTAKGPIVSVLLTKQVLFKNKSNPKSINPPTIGDRVIIEASKDDKTKKVTATVVYYSPNSPIQTAPLPR
jgi:hypothetical protein